jgi:hypothetical protein
MHRFIPVYANSVGARIAEMEVHHHPRLHVKRITAWNGR